MIHNINSIQNLDDLAMLSKFTDEYLVQALANAGQRLGLSGESIKYSNFTFYDLFEKSQKYKDTLSPDDYIGAIRYIYNDETNRYNVQFSIIDNESFISNAKENTSESSTTVDNTVYVAEDVEMSNVLNNIDTYKEGMIIKDDEYLKCLVNCKIIGTEDSDDDNVNVLYVSFNAKTKTLDTYIMCFYVTTDISRNKFYAIAKATNNYDGTFTLTIQEINSSRISDNQDDPTLDTTKFENSFKWTTCNTSDSYDITTSADIDDVEDNSLFSIFFNESVNVDFSAYVFTLTYDEETNTNLALNATTDKIKTKVNNLKSNKIYVNDIVGYINNDMSNSYEEYLKLYNKNIYKDSIKEFTRSILTKLYEHISDVNGVDFSTSVPVLYIPLSYPFNYTVSDVDPLKIYYINDIFVKTSNIDESDYTASSIKELFSSNRILLFDCAENVYEKTDLIDININYDDTFDDYVSSISINDIYTMPFIGKNHKWYINNVNSNIDARGRDAGSPTFLMIKTYKESLLESNIEDLKLSSDKNEVVIYNRPIKMGYKEEKTITLGDDPNYYYVFDIDDETKLQISSNLQKTYLGNTSITLQAQGVAGDVNIIVYKSDKEGKNLAKIGSFSISLIDDDANYNYEILNNQVTNIEYIDDHESLLTPETYKFKINKDYMSASSPLGCTIRLPRVTSSNSQYFENVVMMVMSSFDCIDNANIAFINNNKDISLCTFWVMVDDEEDGLTLQPISLSSDGVALDFSQFLSNLAKSSSTYSDSDYNQLIVKAETSNVNDDNYDYFSLAAKTKDEINDEYGLDNEYSNSLNVRPEYYDTISTTTSSPTLSTTQYKYYIDDISTLSLTNELYQKSTQTENVVKSQTKSQQVVTYITTNKLEVTTYDIANVNSVINGEAQVDELVWQLAELKEYVQEITQDQDYVDNTYENILTNYNEYEPNENVPMVDMKEVLIKNENTINRHNIISFVNDGTQTLAYYSYIGTTPDDDKKNVLHIGTSSYNINIGTHTLLNPSEVPAFTKQDKLSIDFDTIHLNSTQTLCNTDTIVTTKIGNVEYKAWSLRTIVGDVHNTDDMLDITKPDGYDYYVISSDNESDYSIDEIFRAFKVDNNTNATGYVIYLNSLMKRIGIDLSEFTQVISNDLTLIRPSEVNNNDVYIFTDNYDNLNIGTGYVEKSSAFDNVRTTTSPLSIIYYIDNDGTQIHLHVSWS